MRIASRRWITWPSLNEAQTERIKHGLVLACVGDSGKTTYKKSRRGNAEIDRAVTQVLKDTGAPYEVFDFSPYGYDERQHFARRGLIFLWVFHENTSRQIIHNAAQTLLKHDLLQESREDS